MPPQPAFGPRRDYYRGSAYRLGGLVQRLCELAVISADDPALGPALLAADFAVVRADRYREYRLALLADLPYLLVCHDVATMRDPDTTAARGEAEMLAHASAVVFISGPIRDYCRERYELPPHDVIRLRPFAIDLDFEPPDVRVPHSLVYAGGVMPASVLGTPMAYRAIGDSLAIAVEAGWQVHVYPSTLKERAARELRDRGCVVHDTVPERDLLRELSRYTAGLQLFNVHDVAPSGLRYAQLAWPNKCWLYLSAGIPTVSCHPDFEAGRIIASLGGLVIDGAEALASLTEEMLHPVDEAVRRREVIDGDLPRLERLLAVVTGGSSSEMTRRREKRMRDMVMTAKRLYDVDPSSGCRVLAYPAGSLVPVADYLRLTGELPAAKGQDDEVAEQPPAESHSDDDWDAMTRAQLLIAARERGLEVTTRMRVDELRRLLRDGSTQR